MGKFLVPGKRDGIMSIDSFERAFSIKLDGGGRSHRAEPCECKSRFLISGSHDMIYLA